MESLACSKMKPVTIKQHAIYLAMRRNVDEKNYDNRRRWMERFFFYKRHQSTVSGNVLAFRREKNG